MWKTIKDDGPPPYDTLVLVGGTGRVNDNNGVEQTWPKYALAFNACYRPEMCMSQVFDGLSQEDRKKLPIICGLDFEIERWMKVPE